MAIRVLRQTARNTIQARSPNGDVRAKLSTARPCPQAAKPLGIHARNRGDAQVPARHGMVVRGGDSGGCVSCTPDRGCSPRRKPYTAIMPTQSISDLNTCSSVMASLGQAPGNQIDLVPQRLSDEALSHAVHGMSPRRPHRARMGHPSSRSAPPSPASSCAAAGDVPRLPRAHRWGRSRLIRRQAPRGHWTP